MAKKRPLITQREALRLRRENAELRHRLQDTAHTWPSGTVIRTGVEVQVCEYEAVRVSKRLGFAVVVETDSSSGKHALNFKAVKVD